jgi:ethylbenzene hydroxylase subunit alpha/complex iron-sulfur molybdoenzyme family reductase subunit alpha
VAKRRGLVSYRNFYGEERRYDELWARFTMNGHIATHDKAFEEMVRVAGAVGSVPKGTTLETLKRDGMTILGGMGQGVYKHITANEFDPTKPFYSLRWHVDDKLTFPTETRRAQFYIDHDWFLDAGEHMPVHKDAPKIGGDYPFKLTGGHPRHSIHSSHLTQPELMRLHRGQPVMHVNDKTAAKRGIENGETVEVFNDLSDFKIMVRTSPTVAPDQVIIYMWEGQQFENWKIFENLTVGQPKPLHLARGDAQFRYYGMTGSPPPTADRSVRVDFRKILDS